MSTELTVGNQSSGSSTTNTGADQEHKSSMLEGLGNTNTLRQITMILGLAVCLALAVFVLLLASEDEYRPLGKMETQELIQVLDVLDKNKIEYQLDVDVVRVPENKYQEVKLLLSRSGIESSAKNDDFLNKDSGFGVSQRMEQARLKHSQEQNLARAIEELKSVTRAKVILALPKENVFARRKSQSSATVVITTRRSGLGQEEIDAIVDIVASAVQNLDPSRVTVTDSAGRLLNSGSQDGVSARARRELEIVQSKEDEYRNKIQSILIPILGPENFTSQVDVGMDFTSKEQTAKRFNPAQAAVRSEQTLETNSGAGFVGGIPGALTNQPPMKSEIPEQVSELTQQGSAERSGSSHREATRNFEVDTTISHTRQQIGIIQRISVSVAVNYKPGAVGEDGQINREPRTEAELANIRRLLEGAVGFNSVRGDMLEVVTVPFMQHEFEAAPKPELWEQPWFMRVVKFVLAAIVVLVLILTVMRPMFKRMAQPGSDMPQEKIIPGSELAEIEDQYAQETLGLINKSDGEYSYADDGSILIPDLHKDDDMIKAIRALVANEPELSTQVIKSWLQEEDA
ncbi:flagellar basal body M-ring protein FliF [Parashewanella curva]|uniref:Flagellar M-ring protein n=2 Tax=Parashewanella curva TaxID=2338552 RepID=A0A3L8Q398_9GAMM|nr:flagellar basal body M-ring protein FliF [Parashewanella curva]